MKSNLSIFDDFCLYAMTLLVTALLIQACHQQVEKMQRIKKSDNIYQCTDKSCELPPKVIK